jgi:tRNA threonylcarbamoyl adenosine modification protein YeaZ
MATLFLDTSSQTLYLGIDACSREYPLTEGLCEELPACVRSVCADAGKEVADIRSIVYCNGPGSYTGLRTGLSFCKGLALAKDMPMYGVSLFLSRAYLYAHESGLQEEKKFCFYISANSAECFACEMLLSPKAGAFLTQPEEIRVVPKAECLETDEVSASPKKISLDVPDFSWNPVTALQRFYAEVLSVSEFSGSTDFGQHLVRWSACEIPPAPLYGKGVQAKTLKERGIILQN